jgi:DNA-binding transcriptional MerR regulator
MAVKTAPAKKTTTVKRNEKPATNKKYTEVKKPAKKKKEPTPFVIPKGLVTIAELSKKTGISIRMLRRHQQEGIFEPEITSPGKESYYDFSKCFAKLFVHYRDLANRRESTDSPEMKDEKLKQLTAKRTLEEIKVQRIRGELHHTDDIRKIVGSMFSRVHAGLESFDLGIAPLLVNKSDAIKIAEIIRKRLSKILHEITNFDFDAFKKMNAGYFKQLEAEEEKDEDEPD